MLSENDKALLERCHKVLRFLSSDPDETQCQRYMTEHDIRLSGSKPARIKLIIYCGTHISVLQRKYVV